MGVIQVGGFNVPEYYNSAFALYQWLNKLWLNELARDTDNERYSYYRVYAVGENSALIDLAFGDSKRGCAWLAVDGVSGRMYPFYLGRFNTVVEVEPKERITNYSLLDKLEKIENKYLISDIHFWLEDNCGYAYNRDDKTLDYSILPVFTDRMHLPDVTDFPKFLHQVGERQDAVMAFMNREVEDWASMLVDSLSSYLAIDFNHSLCFRGGEIHVKSGDIEVSWARSDQLAILVKEGDKRERISIQQFAVESPDTYRTVLSIWRKLLYN